MTTPAVADSAPVGAIADKSVYNNHVTQSVAGSKPTLKIVNDLPVIRFATDFLSVAHNASLNLQAPITVAGAVDLTSYGPDVRAIISKDNSWYLGIYTTRACPYFVTSGVKNYFAPDVVPTGRLCPFVVRFDADYDVQFWWDRMWGGQDTHTADIPTSENALFIGMRKSGFQPWIGDMFELLLYAGAASDEQAEQLLEYLGNRCVRTTPALLDNAASALTIPTYDETGQLTHPDVYDAGQGNTWNGHRYWMAMTPYANSDVSRENPSIVVSSDGVTWTVPAGLTNPIDPRPDAPGYNADTDLLLAQDNKLYCYYMDNDGSTQNRILCKSSADGVTWGDEVELFTAAFTGAVSPAVIWDGSQYVMWYIDASATPYTLYRRTSVSPDSDWSAASACTIDILTVASRWIWHIDVVLDSGTYHAFVAASIIGTSARLYYATSADGLTWSVRQDRLLTITKSGWDNMTIYRSTAVKTTTGFDIWYSATTSGGQWYVGKTTMVV